MIISPGRRYIFVHIPKTGGTSMAAALEARAMSDDILIGDTPKARRRKRRLEGLTARGRLWKHARLADIDGLAEAERLDDFFIFTMVRNPWDRVASLYYWARAQAFDHPGVALARALPFADYLRHPDIATMLAADKAPAYLTDARGVLRCSHVVRLEDPSDLEPLEAHLGFKLDLPHLNRSERPVGYRDLYTKETAALVAEWFAEDIARFGYSF